MKNKLLTFTFLFFIIAIIEVNAEFSTLGVYKKGEKINLVQTCSNCSFVNLTKVQYPNSSVALINKQMTKQGTEYNYSFSDTNSLGTYIVTTCGDVDGELTCVSYDFQITETGEKVSLSNIIITISLLISSIMFFSLGYIFSKEHWIMKSFFYAFSIGSLIISINSARIIASESSNLYNMSFLGLLITIITFSFFIAYVFINYTIESIKVLKQKKGVRWNY